MKDKSSKKTKEKKFLILIKNIIIVLIFLMACLFVLNNAKYYIRNEILDKPNLIINNNNVTARLKENIMIEDNIIYISIKDIKNFFDNYIYEDSKIDKIITTSDKKVATIGYDNKNITVNGANMQIRATAIKNDGITYLPISELEDVYDVEIKYIEDKNIITIDSLDREQIKAAVSKNTSVKLYSRTLSRTVDKINRGDIVVVIENTEDGWTKVRTANGKIGYIKTKTLTNFITVRENMEETIQIEGKINMFWDYYSEYASAPDRTGEYIEGVNVVSPSFFYINKDGKFVDKVGTSGEKYIEWAKSNGYKVWPMVSNSEAGINVTSKILNSYEKRQELIENIINVCVEYKIDGINIDFENMYEADKDMFSRFIIELVPRMKEIGLVTSVDVTAPDGGANWSLCYDRHVLGDIADYIVFMAYDQYGNSSEEPGTTAGYNWVIANLNKFLKSGGDNEVPAEKLILGIPFYTKVWTQDSTGKVIKNSNNTVPSVSMKKIYNVIPESATITWLDDVRQNYAQWKSGEYTKKIWIEDEKSISEKLSIIVEKNLAGAAFWEKDMETDLIWNVIKEELEKSN